MLRGNSLQFPAVPTDVGDRRILVVEDEETIANVRDYLLQSGFIVDMAADAVCVPPDAMTAAAGRGDPL